jgi:Domain of unknown function (DUF4276)
VSATIYVEGGGDSKDLHIRCREGFKKLLANCGFAGRQPALVACGSRGATFGDFKIAHGSNDAGNFVAMLIDSEDPIADVDKTWSHLKKRDNWTRPKGADDEQVLLMTTCMETWIVADRASLTQYFGAKLQQSALPPLTKLESRDRHDVQDCLAQATRQCSNAYAKGKRSFAVLGYLDPAALEKHLPSFARFRCILGNKL